MELYKSDVITEIMVKRLVIHNSYVCYKVLHLLRSTATSTIYDPGSFFYYYLQMERQKPQ